MQAQQINRYIRTVVWMILVLAFFANPATVPFIEAFGKVTTEKALRERETTKVNMYTGTIFPRTESTMPYIAKK